MSGEPCSECDGYEVVILDGEEIHCATCSLRAEVERLRTAGDALMSELNARSTILRDAEQLVNGDRDTQYGDPLADFTRTAAMWSAYLGLELAPHDVAAMMALLKVSRIRHTPGKEDSWTDLAGYAACGWDCAKELEQP